MTLKEFCGSIRRANGRDLPSSGARWLSRFTNASRRAAQYRAGRVLRPEKDVAWAAAQDAPHAGRLRRALTIWFGAPAGG